MKRSEFYWNSLGTIGLEHLILQEASDGIQADGFLIRCHNGSGLRLRYRIDCDAKWRVRKLLVDCSCQSTNEVRLLANGNGRWFDVQGRPLDLLEGCIDVDVMATPFTNTLPLKRIGLSVGESREIDVAYVEIPSLSLRRVAQRYTCLAQDNDTGRYLYESLNSDFKAELWVDDDQFVVRYPGLWERLNP